MVDTTNWELELAFAERDTDLPVVASPLADLPVFYLLLTFLDMLWMKLWCCGGVWKAVANPSPPLPPTTAQQLHLKTIPCCPNNTRA